jgi:hypothetical protein
MKKIKEAVHKHEKAMHPGKPLTKLAKGGITGRTKEHPLRVKKGK